MSLPEDRSWETGKRQVTNGCVANGVKGAELITFWRASNLYCHQELDEVSTAFIPWEIFLGKKE